MISWKEELKGWIVSIAVPVIILSILYLFGYMGYGAYMLQGHSMEPTLWDGDLLIVAPPDLKEGDMIVFKDPREPKVGPQYIVHRIIKIENGIMTKGDNNFYPDAWLLSQSDIIGEVLFFIPKFQILLGIFLVGLGIIRIVTAIKPAILLWQKNRCRHLTKKMDCLY